MDQAKNEPRRDLHTPDTDIQWSATLRGLLDYFEPKASKLKMFIPDSSTKQFKALNRAPIANIKLDIDDRNEISWDEAQLVKVAQ